MSSQKIRCVIIDDEYLARKYLIDYVSKVPFLTLVGEYNTPLKAVEQLQSDEIDLMFLDIQMPDITGLEFLRSLNKRPFVVFTTAYREYALEGYELDVIDYLLKPFSFNRFLKTVNRINGIYKKIEELRTPAAPTPPTESTEKETRFHDTYIIVRADRKYYRINHDDLIYVEGQKAYVTFHTTDKRITALASLRELEEQLPESMFIRIHKSYIVARKHILSLYGNLVEVGSEHLPVGKSFRPKIAELFGLEE